MLSPVLQKRFRQIIREVIDPALKPLGFQKQGQTYMRLLPEVWWMVRVVRSRWNTHDMCDFNIMFGIYMPEFIARFMGSAPPARPDLADYVIQMGISSPTRGEWWTLRLDDDADAVDQAIKAEVKEQLETILSILQRFQTLGDVIAYFRTCETMDEEDWEPFHRWPNKPLTTVYLGILYHIAGDLESSREAFERAKRSALEDGVPEFAKTVEAIEESTFGYGSGEAD